MLKARNGWGVTNAVANGMSHKRGKFKRENFRCKKTTKDVLCYHPQTPSPTKQMYNICMRHFVTAGMMC